MFAFVGFSVCGGGGSKGSGSGRDSLLLFWVERV